MKRASILEREDLALFINAASTCTGQSEFYGDAASQRVSLSFLHDYVFGNYRRLYALCLGAGVNHYNSALIVQRLLTQGAPVEHRAEEGRMIAGALRNLPPQRVYRLFGALRRAGVNNRRTRASVRTWLSTRDLAFDSVKYRGGLRSVSRHTHQRLPAESHAFLFDGPHSRSTWSTPLFDSFHRARYDQRAIYELPFTVAEGLAAAKGIPRERFLKNASATMTQGERTRLHRHAADHGVELEGLERSAPTRVANLLLARAISEREPLRAPLEMAASRVARTVHLPARVRAVLDCSFSTRVQRRRRVLAVTLAISRVLAAACSDYRALWTRPTPDDLEVTSRGHTNLADPLLEAWRDRPDLIVVVSDGFENDPPGAAAQVVELATRVHPAAVVHLNPVFDATSFMPRTLGPGVPTVGIRDAHELGLKLSFARFAAGSSDIADLQAWLLRRAEAWL